MSKRNEKKIVFVIVEGPSDQMALELLLNKIFINEQVRVKVVHADITTEFLGRSESIVTKVNELVKGYRNANRLTPKDFKEIIHKNMRFAIISFACALIICYNYVYRKT